MKRPSAIAFTMSAAIALTLSLATIAAGADKPAIPSGATLTVLRTLTGVPDCSQPQYAPLVADSSGNLYGNTWEGGAHGNGCVFELSPDGQGGWMYRVIYSPTGGADGAFPSGPLALDSQGNLYGADLYGADGYGAVFELSEGTDGLWHLANSYGFPGTFGGKPMHGASVYVDANGNVFGTTHSDFGAGNAPYGGIYELIPNGNGWTEKTLYVFPESGAQGQYPDGTPIMDRAGNLYGMTYGGGQYGCGTVYRLRPAGNGWILTTLYNFKGGTSDGEGPFGALIFDKYGNLYGTTQLGGPGSGRGGAGGVFKLSPGASAGQSTSANQQWQISWLYFFMGGADGRSPMDPPAFDNAGNLIGTTPSGGNLSDCTGNGCGVIYKLTPSGSGWTESVLYSFTGGSDGSGPWSPPIFDSAGNLYGVTDYAGQSGCGYGGEGCGTVWKLTQ